MYFSYYVKRIGCFNVAFHLTMGGIKYLKINFLVGGYKKKFTKFSIKMSLHMEHPVYGISYSTNPHRQTTTQAGWGMMIPRLLFLYNSPRWWVLQGVLTGYAGRKQAAVASNILSLCVVILERVWVKLKKKKFFFAPTNSVRSKNVFLFCSFSVSFHLKCVLFISDIFLGKMLKNKML